LELEVVNTLTDGLAVRCTWRFNRCQESENIDSGSSERLTLGDWLFAVTPSDTDTVDEVALLSLVAETTGLVGARWTGSTMDNVQLAVFPAPVDR
jgi:hypothetical protein